MTPEPDEATRRRAVYSDLARQVMPSLLGMARRMCGARREAEAEDLVQEALVRGYEAYLKGGFEEGTNGRAWLMRILYNGFVNRETRRRRWESPEDVEALTMDGAVVPTSLQAASADRPDHALLTAELDEPLQRALNSLPADMKACVVLVDMEDWEYAEAATALGVPVGTVRSRLFRARQTLHAQLLEYGREYRRI